MSDNKVTMVDNPMKDGKNIELTNANNDDDDDGIFDEDVVTVDEDTLGEEINIEKKRIKASAKIKISFRYLEFSEYNL